MSSEIPVAPRIKDPCFLVICRDGPDAAGPRATHLDGHLQHVEKHWRSYVTAGPMRDPGGDNIIGSVFLVLAGSVDDAKSIMAGDPYIRCGMYASIEYAEFTNSIGLFVGGKIWESADAIRHRAAGGPSNGGE